MGRRAGCPKAPSTLKLLPLPHDTDTMLGVEGYGSGDDSDDETQQTKPVSPPPAVQRKFGLSLPPPNAASSSKSSSGLSLPAPKKKAPKKIAIGLPTLSSEKDDDDTFDDGPPAKKPRIELGAGSSSLFSMLPAPKNKNPVPAAQERVLGGGRGPGLVFNTGTKRSAAQATVEDVEDEDEDGDRTAPKLAPLSSSILEEVTEEIPAPKKPAAALPFIPPSLAKGKANVSTEDRPTISKATAAKAAAVNCAPAVDFFSLGAPSESVRRGSLELTHVRCLRFVVVLKHITVSSLCAGTLIIDAPQT